MAARKQYKGKCGYCSQEVVKAGVSKHLLTCPQRQAALAKAAAGKKASETLYHLRIEGKYSPDFWLDLEMKGSSSLQTLDTYLRAIWLECCGHMSEFSLRPFDDQQFAMTRKAKDFFEPRLKLVHIYDFGTTSETTIKVVSEREGKPTTGHPIALMARNIMPEWECKECDKPATYLCNECIIEEETSGLLCDEHAEDHPHENYGEPLPLANSPRMGMCGYEGPADPPY